MSALKRKRAKPRARGTGCQLGRRCVAIGEYRSPTWEEPKRLCAIHMADVMMGDSVKAEEMCCRKCGSRNGLQWAHVRRRNYMAIRWDRDNSMALCAACHLRYTHHPLEFEQWCRDVGVPFDELRRRALTEPPMDPLEVIERLQVSA